MLFKSIPNHEGKYSISENGIVISHPKIYGFGKHKERELKQTNQNGYKSIRLGRGKNNFYYIHQLVALTFLEKNPDKCFVNHIDGNKLNNHYSNLEWCTNRENILHMWKNGLSFKKVTTNEEIMEIRKLRKLGFSYKQLTDKFNLTRETISLIVNHKKRFVI